MTEPEYAADSLRLEPPTNGSIQQVRQQNAALREEASALCQKNAELVWLLAEAKRNSQVDRQARRAALNLMEDAIEARRAGQRENAERCRAEHELRASEAKYRRLFEAIDEGFFIIERVASRTGAPWDFRVVEANPAVATQSGVGDVVGKTLRQAFPGESEEWYVTYEQILTTGESIRFQRELVTQGRVLELYAFRFEEERQHRIAVIFKDVSERKRAEADLREAARRKDEFLAILAHELRNPLAPICNTMGILRHSAARDAALQGVCDMMERQVHNIVRLVDELLEVSRITRGLIELQEGDTELATVIGNAVEISGPLIESSDHRLDVTLPPEPIPLHGDVLRLGQVFANLLNNAAKYTERGGQIWLSARAEGSEAVVSIRDTGIGISADMLPAIFDLFTRADRSRGRSRDGLGIGLTIVKKLVEMHRGTISAHSEGLGRGSEFLVRLPIGVASQTVRKAPEGTESSRVGVQHRVLVVDDNDDAAASLGMLLKLLGSDVQVAHDGQAALALIKSYRPNLVFLDLGLPGMDGLEVARQVRQQADFDEVILIALTGWGQVEDRKRTREAGFDHHLVKPADLKTLQSLLAVAEL
jgi:PAS domain S-box-containing protein